MGKSKYLKILDDHYYTFDKSDCDYIKEKGYKKIIIEKQFNSVDNLPDCVINLSIPQLRIPINKLPDKLKILQIDNVVCDLPLLDSQEIGFFPKSLEIIKLKFAHEFDIGLDSKYDVDHRKIPVWIKQLDFDEASANKLGNLDKFVNLTHLSIYRTVGKIQKFPPNIKNLRLNDYPEALDNLPKNLNYLKTSIRMSSKLIVLPAKLQKLKLEISCNTHTILDNLPKLTHLNIMFSKNFNFENLPNSLIGLEIAGQKGGKINLSNLPNLQKLIIKVKSLKNDFINLENLTNLKNFSLSIDSYAKPIKFNDGIKKIYMYIEKGYPIIEKFPDSVEKLDINFPYNFTKLPEKLKTYIGPSFDFFLKPIPIPKNLSDVNVQFTYKKNTINKVSNDYDDTENSEDSDEDSDEFKYDSDDDCESDDEFNDDGVCKNNKLIEKVIEILPPQVKNLSLTFIDELNIKNISKSVEKLELCGSLSENNNILIDCIPNSIKHIKFCHPYHFSYIVNSSIVPEGLISFESNNTINGLNFNNLPTSLKKIKLECSTVDFEFGNLPETLKELDITVQQLTQQSVEHFPSQLEKLNLFVGNLHELDIISNLPVGLRKYHIDDKRHFNNGF